MAVTIYHTSRNTLAGETQPHTTQANSLVCPGHGAGLTAADASCCSI